VLIDTGYGPDMHVKTKGRVGHLPSNLAAAEIDPKSIDTVIISHMHRLRAQDRANFRSRCERN
jgi:glyoxylase-like metal-dependent hydrolase (beta-lactamase superfamily II)